MGTSFTLILQCLKRFEDQAIKAQNREDLVKLFCLEVVPFLAEATALDGLKQEWCDQKSKLNNRLQEAEYAALAEIKGMFQQVKRSIGDSGHELITRQIALLERLIHGKEVWHGSPLYRVLYEEEQRLLGMLLEAGYQKLCSRFGRVATRTTMFEDGAVQELYMEQFTFAPSVSEAYAALDSISTSHLDDPAVAWWYFELALWCWRTPEAYFDMSMSSKFDEQNFRLVCIRSAWKEIVGIRDHIDEAVVPVVFTKDLFQKGLKSLINSVMQYAALEGRSRKGVLSREPAGTEFEMVLDGNELWIQVTFENKEAERFFIQRFHEGVGGEMSAPFKFVRSLVSDGRKGERRADLCYKWESASKLINRLRLPEELKRAFFGKSYGATFQFGGLRVAVELEISKKILYELKKGEQISFSR